VKMLKITMLIVIIVILLPQNNLITYPKLLTFFI